VASSAAQQNTIKGSNCVTPKADPALKPEASPNLFSRVISLVTGNSLASMATFIMMAALARLMPVADFGRVAYAFNVSALLTMFMSFGIPSFLVVVRHREGSDIVAETNRLAVQSVGIVSLLAVVAVFAIWLLRGIPLGVLTAVVLAGIAGMVVPHVVSICQAEGRWSDISRHQVAANSLRAVLVVAITALLRPADCAVVLWASAISLTIGASLAGFKERGSLRLARSLKKLPKHASDFVNLALTNSAVVLASRADVIVAGFLLTASDLGAYSAASTVALGMGLVQSAVMSVSLHDAAVSGCDSRLVVTRQKQLLPYVAAAIITTVLLSPLVIPLLFGARYGIAAAPFRYLAATWLLGILFAPLESHFSAFHSRDGLFLKILQFLAFLVLALVMGRSLTGLAAAVLASRIIGWCWAYMKYQQKSHYIEERI